jgi:DNA-binding transcriptional MerR regulator
VARKLFYRIGEACKQLDIQPYVLRYWETEFPVLNPRKSKAGQRVYSEEELRLIQRIKQLLYEEGYTIAGAKKKLDSELAAEGVPPLAEDGDGPSEPAHETAANDDGEAPAPTPAVLDTGAGQQVERLRSGVREALAQAREILRLLE